MRQRFLLLVVCCSPSGPFVSAQDVPAEAEGPPITSEEKSSAAEVVRFVWPKKDDSSYGGIVTEISEDGTLEVVASPESRGRLVEGLYLGVFYEAIEGKRELPKLTGALVQVQEVKERGAASLKLSDAALKSLAKNMHVLLVRPERSTTKRLKKIPAVFNIERAEPPKDFGPAAAESMNKLRELGVALHVYADMNGEQIVPAVVYGPDGKPWHSWRVLLLSAMDEEAQKLFEEYRLDEPWDGPNNKKLLDKMPDVYRHPLDEIGTSKTRYVVATGEGAALEHNALPFKKAEDFLSQPIRSRTTFGSVIDGLSYTIFAGECGAEDSVPWTKPEDLKFNEDLPAVNKKGGFAAIHDQAEKSKPKFGVFAFMDASVQAIEETIELESMILLLGRNDRQPVDYPQVRREAERSNAFELRIVEGKDGPLGRLNQIQASLNADMAAERDITDIMLRSVSMAVSTYGIHMGRLPSSLDELFHKPATIPRGRKWAGPYMIKEPEDAWGGKFNYKETEDGYELRSAGPDGEWETEDDVVHKS